MREAPARIAFALLGLAAARAPAQQVPAAPQGVPPAAGSSAGAAPKIRVLASTRGRFSAFGEPSAARDGSVAFRATRKDGRDGIYTTAGGSPEPIALVGDPVPDGDSAWIIAHVGARPSIVGAFGCAFTVEFEGGGKGVLVSRGFGDAPEFVADSGEGFRSFGDDALIDGRGNVLFRAAVDPKGHQQGDDFNRSETTTANDLPATDATQTPPVRVTFDGRKEAFEEGLFLEDVVGELTLVAGTRDGFLDLTDDLAMNESGGVAFVAANRVKHWTLFVSSGRTLLEAVETGDEWRALHRPALGPDGRIALVVESKDGAPAVARIPKGGGEPTIVADAKSGFAGLGPNVAIDGFGTIAFVGEREDGGGGLFLADPGGAPRLVVPIGAAAGPDAIAAIRLSNRSFGRRGQVVALVALEPEGQAIVSIELAGR